VLNELGFFRTAAYCSSKMTRHIGWVLVINLQFCLIPNFAPPKKGKIMGLILPTAQNLF